MKLVSILFFLENVIYLSVIYLERFVTYLFLFPIVLLFVWLPATKNVIGLPCKSKENLTCWHREAREEACGRHIYIPAATRWPMWYIGCSWRAIDFPCAWLTTSLSSSSNRHLEEDVCKNCADQRDYIDSSINLSAAPSSIGPNEAKERDDDEPVQCKGRK